MFHRKEGLELEQRVVEWSKMTVDEKNRLVSEEGGVADLEEDCLRDQYDALLLAAEDRIVFMPCIEREGFSWKAAKCDATYSANGEEQPGVTNHANWQEAKELPEAICKAFLVARGYQLV